METKEHSKQGKDEVVKKLKAELGYKTVIHKSVFCFFGKSEKKKAFVERTPQEATVCGYVDNTTNRWKKVLRERKVESLEMVTQAQT
ncbi:hypothetical protein ILYODFUR_025903 [Ilyodon furcidens]|uniref:Uncharacterized protein n=1 Tax=Ilyodon furcidens TaxID=33524 RepID=A0ABV0UYG8_9TELE